MSFFDGFPAFHETSGTAKLPNRLRQRYRAIIEPNQEVIQGSKVLDIASHDGRWSFAAVAAGANRVVGVEARHVLVERANSTFSAYNVPPTKFNFHCCDAIQFLADTEEQFDVVLCLGFFYHTLHHLRLMELMERTGASTIIIDTAVNADSGSSISIHHEDPDELRNAVRFKDKAQQSVPIGVPSRGAIQDMARYVGFTVDEFDWTSLDPDWTHCADYQSRGRGTFICRRAV